MQRSVGAEDYATFISCCCFSEQLQTWFYILLGTSLTFHPNKPSKETRDIVLSSAALVVSTWVMFLSSSVCLPGQMNCMCPFRVTAGQDLTVTQWLHALSSLPVARETLLGPAGSKQHWEQSVPTTCSLGHNLVSKPRLCLVGI